MCGSEVLNTSVMIYWQTDWVDLINEGLQFSNPKEEAGSESFLLRGPSFQSIHSEFELGYPLPQLFHIFLDCEKILPTQDLSSRTLDTTLILERSVSWRWKHYSGHLSMQSFWLGHRSSDSFPSPLPTWERWSTLVRVPEGWQQCTEKPRQPKGTQQKSFSRWSLPYVYRCLNHKVNIFFHSLSMIK